MRPFEPLFTSPHLQTILSHFWPRRLDTKRFPVESKLHETEPGVQVLVETQRPGAAARGEILMVHGLEGSGEAGYMRGLSQAGLEAGYAVNRFHMRSCGGTERLSRTLYHAGLTSDLLFVLRDLEQQSRAPVWLVGFSLGGNVVLKLAGELGEEARLWIAGVCAVSTPIDLAVSVRRVNQPGNWLYQWRFARRMRQRLCATGRYSRVQVRGLRSVFEIDDRITAPSFGFRDAAHYYATQSSIQFLRRIRVPALLIQARDDPLVPFEMYGQSALDGNPNLRLLATDHGGHVGFLARSCPRFWMDHAILSWIGERQEAG